MTACADVTIDECVVEDGNYIQYFAGDDDNPLCQISYLLQSTTVLDRLQTH